MSLCDHNLGFLPLIVEWSQFGILTSDREFAPINTVVIRLVGFQLLLSSSPQPLEMRRFAFRGINKGQLSAPVPAIALGNRSFFHLNNRNPSQPLPSVPIKDRAMKEENIFMNYCPGDYHPIWLGDTFKDGRYTVIQKLGFGVYSTVWLCRDSL
jgi:hypothetical protein